MADVVRPTDLVSLTEIAQMCEVTPAAVGNWQARPSTHFPVAWGSWPPGSLWRRAEIEAWWADRQAAEGAAVQARIEFHERQLRRLREGRTTPDPQRKEP